MDHIRKRALYAKYGVKKYWIVEPTNKLVSVLLLEKDGEYVSGVPREQTEKVAVETLRGLVIDLEKVFGEQKFV